METILVGIAGGLAAHFLSPYISSMLSASQHQTAMQQQAEAQRQMAHMRSRKDNEK